MDFEIDPNLDKYGNFDPFPDKTLAAHQVLNNSVFATEPKKREFEPTMGEIYISRIDQSAVLCTGQGRPDSLSIFSGVVIDSGNLGFPVGTYKETWIISKFNKHFPATITFTDRCACGKTTKKLACECCFDCECELPKKKK